MLYDKPNKKNISKVENARLSVIMDAPLRQYLKICTNGLFSVEDFVTFSNYLDTENFDNELLAHRIDKVLENQILEAIKISKQDSE
jgi:hypothetical protein